MKKLDRQEMKNLKGGIEEGGGGNANCSTVCDNCIVLSVYCSGACTPGPQGIWCSDVFYWCATGNYCG